MHGSGHFEGERVGTSFPLLKICWNAWERRSRCYSAPPNLLAGGEGARCSLPKNPTPALGPSGLELRSFGPSVPIVPILRNDH